MFCGTKSYLAAEILQGKAYAFPVDIWAFGVMIYLMIDGNTPFPCLKEKLTKKNMLQLDSMIQKNQIKF